MYSNSSCWFLGQYVLIPRFIQENTSSMGFKNGEYVGRKSMLNDLSPSRVPVRQVAGSITFMVSWISFFRWIPQLSRMMILLPVG